MRGDIVFRVYGVHAGRDEDTYFGAFRTQMEAVAEADRLASRSEWATEYHNQGFHIREVVVEVDFQIPEQPKPRDNYYVTCEPKSNGPNVIASTMVRVFRRSPEECVAEYERNYSIMGTFEPFRQAERQYALVAPDYTKTAVIDLATGEVIAEEAESYYDDEETQSGAGFCPVGFYVPDWWDVNDGSVIPGSKYWNKRYEWPQGKFGFVWGCHWGDDSSWKVQYLDLSRIDEGVVTRDDRFGHVELATIGFQSPVLQPQFDIPPEGSKPPPFIRASGERPSVTFAVEQAFDLRSGKLHTCDDD